MFISWLPFLKWTSQSIFPFEWWPGSVAVALYSHATVELSAQLFIFMEENELLHTQRKWNNSAQDPELMTEASEGQDIWNSKLMLILIYADFSSFLLTQRMPEW